MIAFDPIPEKAKPMEPLGQLLVNGQPVDSELIRSEELRLASMPEWQQLTDSNKPIFLSRAAEISAVDRVLLHQKTLRDIRPISSESVDLEFNKIMAASGCKLPASQAEIRGNIEFQLRYSRTLNELVDQAPLPTDRQVLDFYNANQKNFLTLEKVEVCHIVVSFHDESTRANALAKLRVAEAELEAGEPFGEVANRYSDCSDKDGALGFFTRGVLVSEFETVVFALKAGERSSIFRTPFGYHIALVNARVSSGQANFEDVQPDIERVMTVMAKQRFLEVELSKLRSDAVIVRVPGRGTL